MATSSNSTPVQIFYIDDESMQISCDDKGSSVDGTYGDDDVDIGDGYNRSPPNKDTLKETEVQGRHDVSGSNKWISVGRDAAIILTCFPSMLWNIDCSAQIITSAEGFPEITITCMGADAEEKYEKLRTLKSLALDVKTKAVKVQSDEEVSRLKNALLNGQRIHNLQFYWIKPEKTVYIFGHSDSELLDAGIKFQGLISEGGQTKKSARTFTSSGSFEEDSQQNLRKGRSFKTRTPSGGFEFTTDAGLNVKVYNADITQLDVDVIVNAANKELQHGGGVARAIALAAGYELDNECSDYIKRRGYLNVGDNMVTTAGNLPNRKVIHALGPQWYHYNDKSTCLKDLYRAVEEILKRCKEKNFRTVAMPVISGGVYGVPKDKCAEVYVKAVEDYSATHGAVPHEFHIVDINDDIIKYMQDAHREFLAGQLDPFRVYPSATSLNDKWQDSGTSNWRRSDSSLRNDSTVDKMPNDRRTSTGGSSYNSSSTGSRSWADVAESPSNHNTFRRNTGLTELASASNVSVCIGDVVSAQVTCIVCACDTSFPGSFVTAICDAGGRDFKKLYQSVIKDKRPKAGQIFYVPGDIGMLRCDRVMFLFVDDRKFDTSFKRLIKNIFDEAEKLRSISIAMPILRKDTLTEKEKREFVKTVLDEAGKHKLPLYVHLVCQQHDWPLRDLMLEIIKKR